MTFPAQRPRRLRRTEALRSMTRETRLSTNGFVYPMFVGPGKGTRVEISSMPGVYQQSADQLVEECREVEGLGIPGVILFGIPEHKDPRGSGLVDPGIARTRRHGRGDRYRNRLHASRARWRLRAWLQSHRRLRLREQGQRSDG